MAVVVMHVRQSQISSSVPAIEPITIPAMAPPEIVLGQLQPESPEPEDCRGRRCGVESASSVDEDVEEREGSDDKVIGAWFWQVVSMSFFSLFVHEGSKRWEPWFVVRAKLRVRSGQCGGQNHGYRPRYSIDIPY